MQLSLSYYTYMISILIFVAIAYICYGEVAKTEKKPFENIGVFFKVSLIIGSVLSVIAISFNTIAFAVAISSDIYQMLIISFIGDFINLIVGAILYNKLSNLYISVLGKELEVPRPKYDAMILEKVTLLEESSPSVSNKS